eukprot:TRINITY_DN8120_c0_g1_i1.p1 TRINITY_DN8120_c0_g1~~TRINITY_DN8120_c0_g1_i1.p1  ORF type:complete len:434 (-),score=64.90 TRINITY_DN8120_c0_g1_i1:294-1547(-)
MEEEEVVDTQYLSRCFIVMDNEIHNEHASDDEIVLFFYPDTVSLGTKMNTISIATSMTAFSDNFSNEPVAVVELKNVKLAYRVVGDKDYILVLTGSVKDSNQALVHHIDLIWECFQFYCGSFNRLMEMALKDRSMFQSLVREKGKDMIPLVNGFHRSAMKFSSMPYIELNPLYNNISSHFVMAWQLLNTLTNYENLSESIYGSCLIYKSSIVCTQLSVAHTRWIANIVEGIGEDKTEVEIKEYTYGPVFFDPSVYNESPQNSKFYEKNESPRDKTPQKTPQDHNSAHTDKPMGGIYIIVLKTDLKNHNSGASAGGSAGGANQPSSGSSLGGHSSASFTAPAPGAQNLAICVLLNWEAYQREETFNTIVEVIQANAQLTKKLGRLLSKIAKGGENAKEISVKETPVIHKHYYNFFQLG